MIGDPSGKTDERKLLDAEALASNVKSIRTQLADIFTRAGLPEVLIVNNLDWFGPMSVINFLRDIGKSLTVNYMMAKDSVKNRLESGISFTEFSYQLLQGFDFVELNRRHAVTIQMGGADQWGNMTSGTELLRRLDQTEGEVLTTPLVTKADGSKFGKSEGGNIWLDPALTSPYRFYQFWLNVGDDEVERMLKVFTFLPEAEINSILANHIEAPHLRWAQKELAEEVTLFIHGPEALEQAQEATKLLFGGGSFNQWASLSYDVFTDIISGMYKHRVINFNGDIYEQLTTGLSPGLFSSKGEARKFISQGGLSINGQKVNGHESIADLQRVHQNYAIVQKGKKNFFVLVFQTPLF
jgi:tyrosyl-tRNA synthetase